MAEPEVVRTMVELGFSLNESRAYHALLLDSPATGYEVGARAGIPRSAVYGVLRRLVASGLARSVGKKPERFVPVDASHVIGLLKQRFEESSRAFEQSVAALDKTPVTPDAFSVRGYTRIIEEARRILSTARSTAVISGWPSELHRLRDETQHLQDRGVCVVVFSHAQLKDYPGNTFSYGLRTEDLERFWKHRLVIVVDSSQTLVASTEGTERDQAVISETEPLAELATNQIVLDINLLANRRGIDISKVMERLLGERVGRLDELLERETGMTPTRAPAK